MTSKSFRGSFELNIHSISAPGTWLPGRNDLYLSVRMLGQYRETRLASPIFPVIFHDRMNFEKTYYLALDHYHAVELLADDEVYMELIQLSDLYERGVVLATYTCNTRDFLYPYSSSPPTYATDEREVLMRRTPDFPGIAPKIEFSCRAVVRQLYPSVLDDTLIGSAVRDELAASRKARSLSRSSRPRARSIGSSYSRPTLSTIYRSRSPSASKRLTAKGSDDEDRPPFVVRKLDKDLTSRVPGADDTVGSARRSRSPSATRSLRGRSLSPSRYRPSSATHTSGYWRKYLSDIYTDPLYRDYYRDYMYPYYSRYYDPYYYRYPYYDYSYLRDLYGDDTLALDLALARRRRLYYY